MITHLHIQNFKCLLDVQIDLAPFTILIGPNDSGKSSLLDAIGVLGRTSEGQGVPSDLLHDLVWKKEATRAIEWTVQGTASGMPFTYTLGLSPDKGVVKEELTSQEKCLLLVVAEQQRQRHASFPQQNPRSHLIPLQGRQTALSLANREPALHPVVDDLRSSTKYALDPEALRQPAAPAPQPSLGPTGDNLVAVLDSIASGPDRTAIIELERILHEEIPSLRGIALSTIQKSMGQKALEFTLARNGPPYVTIPAAQASEGALLLTAFLALVYGNTPNILLIEEPENGLHPSRLKLVVDILRKISTGEVGNRPRQVIITTHSPILLNFARPEEVRIFQRDAAGGTQVTPMTKVRDIDKLLKEFAVGELWYLLGEQSLVTEQAV